MDLPILKHQSYMLDLLRDCAWAPPCRDNGKQQEYHYQQAVERLNASPAWKTHEQVQMWLTTGWLSISDQRVTILCDIYIYIQYINYYVIIFVIVILHIGIDVVQHQHTKNISLGRDITLIYILLLMQHHCRKKCEQLTFL